MPIHHGQEWDRDGHRLRIIDDRVDGVEYHLIPVHLKVKALRGWHSDVDFEVFDAPDRGFIARDTLVVDWDPVAEVTDHAL